MLLPLQQRQELCRQVTAACVTRPCHQAIYLLAFAVDLTPALVCSFISVFEASLQPSVKLCHVNQVNAGSSDGILYTLP